MTTLSIIVIIVAVILASLGLLALGALIGIKYQQKFRDWNDKDPQLFGWSVSC